MTARQWDPTIDDVYYSLLSSSFSKFNLVFPHIREELGVKANSKHQKTWEINEEMNSFPLKILNALKWWWECFGFKLSVNIKHISSILMHTSAKKRLKIAHKLAFLPPSAAAAKNSSRRSDCATSLNTWKSTQLYYVSILLCSAARWSLKSTQEKNG